MEPILLVFCPYNESRIAHLTKLSTYPCRLWLITKDVPNIANSFLAFFERCFLLKKFDVQDFSSQHIYPNRTRIIGVISLSETGVYFCSELAAMLNLNFIAPTNVHFARNKYLMRERCAEIGVPTVKYGKADTLHQAISIAEEINYPVVVKPFLAGAKRFVKRIDNSNELTSIFSDFLKGGVDEIDDDPIVKSTFSDSKHLLIEKFIFGKSLENTILPFKILEASVEGFVYNDVIEVIGIHDKPLPENGPFFEELIWTTPSRLDIDTQNELVRLAKKVARDFKLNYCFFHAEFKIAESGPIFLEIAARMGGGPIYNSIKYSTGIDMIDILYKIATNQPINDTDLTPIINKVIITLGIFAPEGPLINVIGLDKVKSHPKTKEVVAYEKVGDYIFRAPKSLHCTIHVMIEGDSHTEAEQVALWVMDQIKFNVPS